MNAWKCITDYCLEIVCWWVRRRRNFLLEVEHQQWVGQLSRETIGLHNTVTICILLFIKIMITTLFLFFLYLFRTPWIVYTFHVTDMSSRAGVRACVCIFCITYEQQQQSYGQVKDSRPRAYRAKAIGKKRESSSFFFSLRIVFHVGDEQLYTSFKHFFFSFLLSSLAARKMSVPRKNKGRIVARPPYKESNRSSIENSSFSLSMMSVYCLYITWYT